ncbi:DsbA family protein [Virgibacillus xinjiangensis]|uniref:DsbA family protein n=1 Tax=Virgibacillus xinjiangensis TaxID=393090 RepID=A0ABV7CZX3_9BACI
MKIEVWSDFVCPFCYMGKQRLENALEKFTHNNDVILQYKSYELNPAEDTVPGRNIHDYLAESKGIPRDQAKSMNENVGRQAAELGLIFNFESMQPTNTFDAHRVAQYAGEQGKGREMTERLLKAYFTEGRLISDHATLIELAEETGLDPDAVTTLLKVDDYAIHVRGDEEQARQIGVQGVPFFVFNEKYAVSGAQPEEVFVEVLEQVWEEENSQPDLEVFKPKKKAKTTYCTDEGCETI